MLNEAKLALRVTASAYDAEIMRLLEAGARDLEIAGVRLHGRVSYTTGTSGVDDLSTIRDPLEMRAILTYARMYFGSPPDFDRLQAAYETQKVQLMHAEWYTDFGGEDEC